jgi:hypothetical protein
MTCYLAEVKAAIEQIRQTIEILLVGKEQMKCVRAMGLHWFLFGSVVWLHCHCMSTRLGPYWACISHPYYWKSTLAMR